MEIELKYLIPDRDIIDKMWQEAVFKEYGTVDSVSQIEMDAIYYDTEDRVLGGADTAFRVRKEGQRYVATLKWGGHQHEGLHEREELNIQLPEDPAVVAPTLEVFAQHEKGRQLVSLVGEKELKALIETSFTRQIMRIDTGNTICEVALDVGDIITPAGNLDICELEIELFSGDVSDIEKIGADLEKRFGLKTGVESKFGRGIKLITENLK
ncbi:MAG: CYTH domain-containing protein [Firmicutes bacterium]|nr:CYTH domain-containing protein [Bacillota bacterium]